MGKPRGLRIISCSFDLSPCSLWRLFPFSWGTDAINSGADFWQRGEVMMCDDTGRSSQATKANTYFWELRDEPVLHRTIAVLSWRPPHLLKILAQTIRIRNYDLCRGLLMVWSLERAAFLATSSFSSRRRSPSREILPCKAPASLEWAQVLQEKLRNFPKHSNPWLQVSLMRPRMLIPGQRSWSWIRSPREDSS